MFEGTELNRSEIQEIIFLAIMFFLCMGIGTYIGYEKYTYPGSSIVGYFSGGFFGIFFLQLYYKYNL